MPKFSPSPKSRLALLCLCALLAALSILLGKYLAFNIGEWIRISFENLPILLAGLYLGPLAGAAVGAVADLVGCVLVGYAINPLITLGAVAVGLLSGLLGKVKEKRFPTVLLTVLFSHAVGSVLIKTLGLSLYFALPFFPTLLWRSLSYLAVGAAECALLWAVCQSKALTRELAKIAPNTNRRQP